jgi:hypothetical protein
MCESELVRTIRVILTDTATFRSSRDIGTELRSIKERVNADRRVVAVLQHGNLLGLEEARLKILEGADDLEYAHWKVLLLEWNAFFSLCFDHSL